MATAMAAVRAMSMAMATATAAVVAMETAMAAATTAQQSTELWRRWRCR